jgi:succinate dehydrogenase/fumarate reductase flavoprotein subunit
MKDLEKLLMKKSASGKMSAEEVQAKMDVLEELLEMAQSEMGGRVKHGMDSMKKVSVIAPDQEGLEKGLEKAKELVESSEETEANDDAPEKEEQDLPASEDARSMTTDREEDEDLFSRPKSAKKSRRMFDEE